MNLSKAILKHNSLTCLVCARQERLEREGFYCEDYYDSKLKLEIDECYDILREGHLRDERINDALKAC